MIEEQAFKELYEIIDRLLGPQGCEWDRVQTLKSMRSALVEEVYELIEAINSKQSAHIEEELGDLLLNAIFLCKLAEKESHTSFHQVAKKLSEKLVRRHPHVFGTSDVSGVDSILDQWEKIKLTESGNSGRTSVFDGIPKGLPSLARAQKMAKKLQKQKLNIEDYIEVNSESKSDPELHLGATLLHTVVQAQAQKNDAEQSLTAILDKIQSRF